MTVRLAERLRGHTSTLTFIERYSELRDLGYRDWQTAARLGMTMSSLERQLGRYGLPISALLRDMAYEERQRWRSRGREAA